MRHKAARVAASGAARPLALTSFQAGRSGRHAHHALPGHQQIYRRRHRPPAVTRLVEKAQAIHERFTTHRRAVKHHAALSQIEIQKAQPVLDAGEREELSAPWHRSRPACEQTTQTPPAPGVEAKYDHVAFGREHAVHLTQHAMRVFAVVEGMGQQKQINAAGGQGNFVRTGQQRGARFINGFPTRMRVGTTQASRRSSGPSRPSCTARVPYSVGSAERRRWSSCTCSERPSGVSNQARSARRSIGTSSGIDDPSRTLRLARWRLFYTSPPSRTTTSGWWSAAK